MGPETPTTVKLSGLVVQGDRLIARGVHVMQRTFAVHFSRKGL